MKTEIKIGTTVMTPVTDSDGEVSYVFGVLKDINSRFAKIDVDGEMIRVGKSKIELVEHKVTKPAKIKAKIKTVKVEPTECPHCGDDAIHHYKTLPVEADVPKLEYVCVCCGEEFGDRIKHTGRIAENYEYKPCVAASGRMSCDNADDVAAILRGRPLEEVYQIVADMMKTDIADLATRYQHLNNGQQRMNLGNRLRGFLRKQEQA